MKSDGAFEQNDEVNKRPRTDPGEEDHHRKKSSRKKHLAEVETSGGGDVEIEIGVMNIMKAPEKRNDVVCPVPPPVGVIQQKKPARNRNPSRQPQPVQQTHMPMLRPNCD